MKWWEWLQRSEGNTLQSDYDKAIKSVHIKFVEEVLHRWGMEIGNDDKYHELQKRLWTLQSRSKRFHDIDAGG